MHQKNISLLSLEAERLLNLSTSLTKEVISNSNVTDSGINEAGNFSKSGLNNILETLKNEQVKLANQEMVIAIVGTMKAGKSTTINAVVGTEVLPNRNRPMTALPTLIRHRKGKHVPELFFSNLEPLAQLATSLYKVLSQINLKDIQGIDFDADMNELIEQIKKGSAFSSTRYEGAEEIFNFLKGLNDVVRLSKALNVAFPFEAYATIEQIPVIEVEFAHLAEFENTQGQLSILDTPGPNEADQPHLKRMLTDQLNKASAVLMVMDYTQLRSTSDADVRASVSSIGENVPLYVLVNKFDQKDRNGDNEEQIKNLVANDLMKGKVNYDDVFPVASMWGYLANRARHEMNVYGKLPDTKSNPWVIDFAEEAIGRRWGNDDLEDKDTVFKSAEDLWKDSLFSEPMTKVIQSAHSKAALFALNSASSQLNVYADKYQQYFDLRRQGIEVDIENLHHNVAQLQQDIDTLIVTKEEVKNIIDTNIANVVAEAKQSAVDVKRKLESEVANYFEKGKRDEEEKVKITTKQKMEQPSSSILCIISNGIFSNQINSQQGQDFDPDRTEIRFDDIKEAQILIEKIGGSTAEILSKGEKALSDKLELELDNLENILVSAIAKAIVPIEKSIQGGLEAAGFKVQLQFPQLNKRNLRISVDTIFNDAIQHKSETVTRHRRQSGVWGGICRFFNTDDWGWESYETTERSFVININNLKANVNSQVDNYLTSVTDVIEYSIKEPVHTEAQMFFESFANVLENIRTSLFNSIADQQRDAEIQEQVKQVLNEYLKETKVILQDSNLLEQDVKNLLSAEAN